MNITSLCSPILGAELKSLGLGFCTVHAYDFTKESLVFSWTIIDGSESRYFPLISIKVLLEFFWENNYSVCVNMQNKIAWIQDADNYFECRNSNDSEEIINEADYLAKLLSILLRTKHMTITIVNTFLWKRLSELKAEHNLK